VLVEIQHPYLPIFGFIGITDIEFISAQPMDITPDLREKAVAAAIAQAESLAGSPG
jgi:FMN-dependent NADH-azoreductase